jgi:hypothetical protein
MSNRFTVAHEHTADYPPHSEDVYWVVDNAQPIPWDKRPLFIRRREGRDIDSCARMRAEALARLLNELVDPPAEED